MALRVGQCQECGEQFTHEKVTGCVPKRCEPCREVVKSVYRKRSYQRHRHKRVAEASAYWRERHPLEVEKSCTDCGTTFMADGQGRTQRTLCDSCRQERGRVNRERYKTRHRQRLLADARAYARKRYATDPDHAERQRAWSRNQSPEYKAEIRRRSYLKHADKRREAAAAYRDEHPEKVKDYTHKHYLNTRVSAKPYRPIDTSLTDEQRAERKKTLDKRWREQNSERVSRNRKAWVERNPERYKITHANAAAKRRARKQLVAVEDIDRAAIFERDGGRCHICGRKCSFDDFHLDHLIPISKGGAHTAENVAVSHPRCNLRRGAGRLPAQLRLVG